MEKEILFEKTIKRIAALEKKRNSITKELEENIIILTKTCADLVLDNKKLKNRLEHVSEALFPENTPNKRFRYLKAPQFIDLDERQKQQSDSFDKDIENENFDIWAGHSQINN